MNSSIMQLDKADITLTGNVRLPNLLHIDTLMEDIARVGLDEPLMVWERPDGVYVLIRGHRRLGAITKLERLNSERYAELFSEGVTCKVVTGITHDEAERLKVDQLHQVSLTHPVEVQLAANKLFGTGMSEAEAVVALAMLIDKVSPLSTKARKQLADIDVKIAAATDATSVHLLMDERNKFTKSYRHGYGQRLHNAYRTPRCTEAMYFHACGECMTDDVGPFPQVGAKEITALWKAHQADMEATVDGIKLYSKENPGPTFKENWEKLIAEQTTSKANAGETRPKSMSATAITKEIEEGVFYSQLAKQLAEHHTGAKNTLEAIKELDTCAHYTDVVKERSPKNWESFKILAIGLKIAMCVEYEQGIKAKVETETAKVETETVKVETETVKVETETAKVETETAKVEAKKERKTGRKDRN